MPTTTAPHDIDYAQTKKAQKNRAEKATALAKHAWRSGMSPEQLAAHPPTLRNTLARQAGATTPSQQTWDLAVHFLNEYATFAAANPGHPGILPQDLTDAATTGPTPSQRAPRTPTTVGPDVMVPNGWEVLAQLPVLTRAGTACIRCGQPSVIGTPDGFRCTAHPPQRGEWGAELNWAPNKTGPCLLSRCYCGTCDHYTPA